MGHYRLIRIGALALIFFMVEAVVAQENGIEVGAFTVYPTVGLSVGYDDNVALSADEPISSAFYLVAPAVRLETGTARSRLEIEYSIERGEYVDSKTDSFTDHRLTASWLYDPTVRSDLGLRAEWERGHDRRGEGLREEFAGTLDRDVDEFDHKSLGARYEYGAAGARGLLAVFADWTERSYRNNRDFSARGDFDSVRYGAELGWRIAPRTRLLAQASRQDIDYDLADRDGELTALAVGLEWEGSARTEGRALVGRQEREFDTPGLEGFTGGFWEIGASWRPVERSEFGLRSRRSTDESFGVSNLLVRRETMLSWRHVWRPRFVTSVDLGSLDEDFRPGPRDDELIRYGLSAEYQFRRWMIFGAGFQHVDRDSVLPEFDYDRSEVVISVQLSL